jgi:hypothetical protein
MTLTLENLPKEVDQALRALAEREGKTLNQVAVDALRSGLRLPYEPKHRDLSDLAGTWVEDPRFDEIMREQDKIDTEMWK